MLPSRFLPCVFSDPMRLFSSHGTPILLFRLLPSTPRVASTSLTPCPHTVSILCRCTCSPPPPRVPFCPISCPWPFPLSDPIFFFAPSRAFSVPPPRALVPLTSPSSGDGAGHRLRLPMIRFACFQGVEGRHRDHGSWLGKGGECYRGDHGEGRGKAGESSCSRKFYRINLGRRRDYAENFTGGG